MPKMNALTLALALITSSSSAWAVPQQSATSADAPGSDLGWLSQRNEFTGGANASIGGNTAFGTASAGASIGYHYLILRNLQVGGETSFDLNFGDRASSTDFTAFAMLSGTFGGNTPSNDFFMRAGPGINISDSAYYGTQTYFGGVLRMGKRFELSRTVAYAPYASVSLWNDGQFVWRITPLALSFLF